ncbi:MAG TPA: LysM peptidoglycan-binding domain-containing protein [Falsiroseomonas sp.]|jgi:nucleoid-associated protein YgaU|nr:LysM peptidoglycan-binding domain-containing protein [Falsiroseomonas sp.]
MTASRRALFIVVVVSAGLSAFVVGRFLADLPPSATNSGAPPTAPAPAAESRPAALSPPRLPAAPTAMAAAAVAEPPPAAAGPPRFDVVRVGARGVAVVAGRAAAGAEVLLLDEGREIGRARADPRGEWVILPSERLRPGTRQFSLLARLGGTDLAGPDVVVVSVPAPAIAEAPRPGSDAPTRTGANREHAASPADAAAWAEAALRAEAAARAEVVARAEAEAHAMAQAGSAHRIAEAAEAASRAEAGRAEAAQQAAARQALELAEASRRELEARRRADVAAVEAARAEAAERRAAEAEEPQRQAARAEADTRRRAELAAAEAARQAAARRDAVRREAARLDAEARRRAELAAAEASRAEAARQQAVRADALVRQAARLEAEARRRVEAAVGETTVAEAARLAEGTSRGAPSQPLVVLLPQAQATPRVLQGPAPRHGLALGLVDYDEAGTIRFAGTAAPGATVRVYVNDRHAGDTRADAQGQWTLAPAETIAYGRHRLRLDQIAAAGAVAARIELPFQRDPLAQGAAPQGRVVVQPGNNLWRLARDAYGSGMRFTVIYEANRDQIRNPDLIFPGQVFALPPETPADSNRSR